tara:strand:- start:398 stop:568 length:171 start_codon:yes stop_codon:yes gene_type:complete
MNPAVIMTIMKVAKAKKGNGSKAGGSLLEKYGSEGPKISFEGSEKSEEKPEKEEKE